MPSPLETWFSEIPPITRIYVSGACITSIAVVNIKNKVTTRDNSFLLITTPFFEQKK